MANGDRVPVFELHIRPMMRLLDRDHMLSRFDLWKLEDVWAHRSRILEKLKSPAAISHMPTLAEGGPWPNEWIALFERWIAVSETNNVAGHHLEVGLPDAGYTITPSFGGRIEVTASFTAPSPGYRAWLEIKAVRETEREYILSVEPPLPSQSPSPQGIPISESFRKQAVERIFIEDRNGIQEFPVP